MKEKVELNLSQKQNLDYMKVVIYCENVMEKTLDELKEEAKKALERGEIWHIEVVSPAKKTNAT